MIKIDERSISKKDSITVDFFYENAKKLARLSLHNENAKLQKLIYDQNLHRPGLALAGFVDLFSYKRVQVFGNTELHYLAQLNDTQKRKTLARAFSFDLPCVILTDDNKPFPILLEEAEKRSIPVFSSSHSTTKLIYLVSDFLDDQFAPRISLHGSFVDVYGVGILFVGKSGIGKSEVALDLVERGHRLVADDIIIFTKKGEGILMGTGTRLAQHFLEIRGLGIIDISKVFGIRAIRFQKRLEIIVELEVWDEKTDYTRTGLDETSITISEVEIPYVKLPIFPGKNITVISEVISLNYLLKHYGYDAAKEFQEKLNLELRKKQKGIQRGVDYFEHDFE